MSRPNNKRRKQQVEYRKFYDSLPTGQLFAKKIGKLACLFVKYHSKPTLVEIRAIEEAT